MQAQPWVGCSNASGVMENINQYNELNGKLRFLVVPSIIHPSCIYLPFENHSRRHTPKPRRRRPIPPSFSSTVLPLLEYFKVAVILLSIKSLVAPLEDGCEVHGDQNLVQSQLLASLPLCTPKMRPALVSPLLAPKVPELRTGAVERGCDSSNVGDAERASSG
jgi:hypothetical protein